MVLLGVFAFCLPYMPGNPPFPMLENWHLAQLTAHVALASLLPLKRSFVEAFFFHEYGRRVGMVPRSSLKEGKKRQMVEKGTKTPKTNPKPNTQARRPTPPSCSLPYTLGETCETETSDN